MRLFLIIATLCGAMSLPADAAQKCPVTDAQAEKDGYAAAVEAAIKAAPDCARAYQALEACQLGSSADNALSDIVVQKCEPLFLPRATAGTKRAYRRALSRCDRVALKNEGTMYQSMAAVCRAGAARDFSRK